MAFNTAITVFCLFHFLKYCFYTFSMWKWQLTPVFLPVESHGQRSLAGYSPWGCIRVGHNLATKPPHIVVTGK